jgi:cytoskeletal protein RodZ
MPEAMCQNQSNKFSFLTMTSPLGQKLKEAREQRGLSLLDVSHETKIPVQRLHFLETDNFAGFGSLTYARAFLRRYSEFLKVNAEDMLDDLPGGVLGGPRDYRYLTENHGSWVAPRGQSVGRLSSAPTRRHTRKSPVPAGIFIFFLVLVGTGIWGKYVSEESITDAQPVFEAKEISAAALTPPKPALIETHAITVSTNAQVSRMPEPSTQILKAVPLNPQEVEQLNANSVGKAVSAE